METLAMSREDWQNWDRMNGCERHEGMINVTKLWNKLKTKLFKKEPEYIWVYECCNRRPGDVWGASPYCPLCGYGKLVMRQVKK